MQGTKLFVINSKDRLAHSVSTSDCRFCFKALGAKSAEVVSFQVPSTQYNVKSTNNTVYFNDGSDHNFALTPGNYDVYDFIAELQTQFNTVSTDYLVTYSNVSMKITIANPTLNFSLLFGTNTTNSMSGLLGFDNVDSASVLAHTGNNCINLSLPLYLCCFIDEFDNSVNATDDTTSTFVFPNYVNGGDIALFNENTAYKMCSRIFENNIQSLHIRFTYVGGEELNLNGGDWVMVLRLCYC